jgi:hypothetical protein
VKSHQRTKRKKKEPHRSAFSDPAIFVTLLFTIHALNFNLPIISFIVDSFFFHDGTDSQGSAARCEETGDSCEAWD